MTSPLDLRRGTATAPPSIGAVARAVSRHVPGQVGNFSRSEAGKTRESGAPLSLSRNGRCLRGPRRRRERIPTQGRSGRSGAL